MVKFLNSIPEYFGYDPNKAKPYNLMWWYRQFFHFIGGILLSSFGELGRVFVFPNAVRLLNSFFWVLVIVSKEIIEDRVTQPREKTIIDSMSWALGLGIGSCLLFLIGN